MIFRHVVLERVGISGPGREKKAALDWCAENGFAVEKDFRRGKSARFQILGVRILRDAGNVKRARTAAQLRSRP